MTFLDEMHEKYGPLGPPFPGRADPLAPPQRTDCKPDNTELVIDPDTRCRCNDGWGACGKPGVLRMFLGCGHEHLAYADLCAGHQHLVSWVHWCECKSQMKVIKTEPIGR